ncbi:phosphoethanolamine transferase [Thalassobellus citreus]|uniref:phosphoethanolamine transferase n=1 Tax=Thalassobellus citreus TaxID=3367752 RepID=UPI0037B6C3BB
MKFKQYKNFIIFLLPFIFKYIFIYSFSELSYIEDGEIKEDLLFCLLMGVLFCSNVFKRHFFNTLICFIYILYFVLETSSYMAVSSNFSSSYMYLLIESNKGELSEFGASYISTTIIFFIILMIALFFIIRKVKFKINLPKKILVTTFVSIGVLVILKLTGLIENNAYHNIVRGTYGYFKLQNSVKFNANLLKQDIKITANNEVLVVVLGESTTSEHMQIYGYERETTPLLSSIKDSLYIYNDVISSDVITTKSVPKILTSIDNTSKRTTSTNIIDLFNKAGYETYWLSNQRPIGFYDNQISTIASVSSHLKFFNHQGEVKTTSYDGVIFPDFKTVLKREGKKVVFLRLIGTHFDYDNRYPSRFKMFLSSDNLIKKDKILNNYDNAVLYNDFVVYSFIKELQKYTNKSALLYLSDHGENVYDNNTDFFGRSETVLTKSMFEIPFFIWTSSDFEFPKDFDYKPDRVFMADHTYESIGHLFGVMYKDMDASRSIFSDSFIERRRKVIDNIDYETHFLDKDE